jgi:hypothetical protein
MTDENRNESGQFSSAEPLTGERALEADQGYIPAVEEPVERGPDDARELADTLAESRVPDEPEEVLGLTDPDDTEPKQALSQQQLTDTIAEDRRAHESMIETVNNAEVAAFADNLREYLGPELGIKPEQKAEAQPAEAEPSVDGLAPDIAKALAHPQVREAVEAELSVASRQREA